MCGKKSDAFRTLLHSFVNGTYFTNFNFRLSKIVKELGDHAS